MRYYQLSVANNTVGAQPTIWTTHPNGVFDPGALNIEFDVLTASAAEAVGGFSVTLHGISLASIAQASNFAGCALNLYGGFKKGLPLANPAQSGLIASGTIFQSWGNWIGTEMTLNFTVLPSNFTSDTPGNFVFNWPAGTPLSIAISNTIGQVFPGAKINFSLSEGLVLKHTEVGHYQTLEDFAAMILDLTEGWYGDSYQGVSIYLSGGQFYVTDFTQPPTAKQIAFTDLVGQPTWIDVNTMQMTCQMRADLQLGDMIQMPQGLANIPGVVTANSQALPSSLNYKTAFQGKFWITQVRHVGNLRDPNGDSWVSIFNCVPVSNGQS